MSDPQRLSLAEKHKAAGNEQVSAKKFDEAIDSYALGIDWCAGD